MFGAVVAATGGAPLSVAANLAYPLADLVLVAFASGGLAMTEAPTDAPTGWAAGAR